MRRYFLLLIFFPLFYTQFSRAARLVELKVVDQNCLQVLFLDGNVEFNEDVHLPGAYTNNTPSIDINKTVWYGNKLNTTEAVSPQNWNILSTDDPDYGTTGINPSACYRKSKITGMAELSWSGNDYQYETPMEHTIYLTMPHSLKPGKTYTIQVNSDSNSDTGSIDITFDNFRNISEAIHLNLVGFLDDQSVKSADLYLWMGDGGARNYAAFQGKKVYIYNLETKDTTAVGTVAFWKSNGSDSGGYNLINSNVWKIDFTGFSTPGTYRLVVEDVGSSQDFRISKEAYHDPFMVSTRGYFYMRVGQDSTSMRPIPRRPLYIPGKSPANTKIYITTVNPFSPEWSTLSSGDQWDGPNSFAQYKKPGSPQNYMATGGHADAFDWDRHLAHVSNIYDMLLPFILNGGTISDDNLGIAESGNGIPDIIDEARNEVDFWLSLRDGKAYGHGLTNPNSSNVMYQAGSSAMAAWANAANCAMLSDCFRVAGLSDLMKTYRDSAIVAYQFAGSLADQQLDAKQEIGDRVVRGRDLKMMAAAYLYNVTGDTIYEDEINHDSTAKTNTSPILSGSVCQIWGTAAYLMTKRPVHFATLYDKMKASIINEARIQEANYTLTRPSRRATDNATGYWKTAQNVDRTMIAHTVSTNPSDRAFFENALVLEADWGLGRNPLNMIQMTTATTPLETKRSVENMYIGGRNDGTPGLEPGMTPYLNTDDWGTSMVMGRPSWMTAKCYPDYNSKWPKAEGYFNTRYVYAHSEFTPRQTMRGKMALYGYLYGLYRPHTQSYSLKVSSPHGAIQISPEKATYSYGDSVTITLVPDQNYTFKSWNGDASGTVNPLKIVMYGNMEISATFEIPDGTQKNENLPVTISPNPASGFIKISKSGNSEEMLVSISDINGKQVIKKKMEENPCLINIQNLEQGVYSVRIVQKNRVADSKLVVLRN